MSEITYSFTSNNYRVRKSGSIEGYNLTKYLESIEREFYMEAKNIHTKFTRNIGKIILSIVTISLSCTYFKIVYIFSKLFPDHIWFCVLGDIYINILFGCLGLLLLGPSEKTIADARFHPQVGNKLKKFLERYESEIRKGCDEYKTWFRWEVKVDKKIENLVKFYFGRTRQVKKITYFSRGYMTFKLKSKG